MEKTQEIDIDAIRGEMNRILESRTFRPAQSQRDFLRYAVQEALAGRADQMKEYRIGTEALGRDASFDPRLDPIVRTQARKLRARLEKYYADEGLDSPLRIGFPKGSYVPSFLPPDAPRPQDPTINPVEHTPPRPRSRFRPIYLLPAAVVVLLAWVAISRLGGGLFGDNASIAVLPFVNLSEGEDSEFLSDGLTEELIDSLAQVPGLQIVARTSAFRFKGKNVDARDAGQKLNVRNVLVGSVRKSGDRLRITVQLNNTSNGEQLWSGSYDRPASDARAIQWEISRAVTNALGVRRPHALLAQSVAPHRPNPGAYQDYLRGKYFWNKLTRDGLRTAIEYFDKSIAQDPSFAPAYIALADSYVIAPQVSAAPPPTVLSKIRAAAAKALDLDPGLGEAHFDLAVCAEHEFDWPTAEREFQQGLKLSPGSAIGHLWYSKFLALTGRKSEVLTHRTVAAELDPVSPYAVQAVAGYHSVMGNYDQAIAQFRSALALDPGFGFAHQGLGVAYILKGMPAEGITELQTANKLMEGPRRMALLGWGYGVVGQKAEARRVLDTLLNDTTAPAIAIAQVYIGLGEADEAFAWIEKAIDQRDLDVTLLWDSPYQPLRSDPRFAAALHRMKLTAKQ